MSVPPGAIKVRTGLNRITGKTGFLVTDRIIGVTGRSFISKKLISRKTLINGPVVAVKSGKR